MGDVKQDRHKQHRQEQKGLAKRLIPSLAILTTAVGIIDEFGD